MSIVLSGGANGFLVFVIKRRTAAAAGQVGSDNTQHQSGPKTDDGIKNDEAERAEDADNYIGH